MNSGPEADLDRYDSTPATVLDEPGPAHGQTPVTERRESVRHPFGGPLWWKSPQDEQFHQGWLIERSSTGIAFLVKGRATPLEGTRIRVSDTDPITEESRAEEGLIRRVKHVHADLFLVAAQLKPPAP